jgi:poly(A) polymerase
MKESKRAMDSKRSPKQAAVDIIRHLRANGHIALLAGGCVRDMLLGHRPKDYDVATDATPPRVISLFRRTRQVGAQFGVVLVKQGDAWTEVATFRSDHEYEDGRHPSRVTFGGPEQDAQRRDFTINGMFYDPIGEEVVDYVGGQADLRAGLIRTIGSPDQRFAEDHLRLIRAVRFAARFRYPIEPATYQAIRMHAHLIARVSAERIREELEKIMADTHRGEAFRQLADVGLLAHLWPEARWDDRQISLSADMLDHLPEKADFAASLACMLIRWPKQQVDRACRDLTCSNDLRKRVVWLVGNRDAVLREETMGLADLKFLMQNPGFEELLILSKVWLEAEKRPLLPYHRLVRRARAIPPEEVAPRPLIDGADLIAMGLKPGPAFKRILDRVYRSQLEGIVTTKAQAKAMAKTEAGL